MHSFNRQHKNLLENIDPGLYRDVWRSETWKISKSKHTFIDFISLEYKIILFAL